MKRLGLIGSQTSNSPLVYWRTIHDEARRVLGDEGPADILVHCNHGALLRSALLRNDWNAIKENLVNAGRGLTLAGAEGLVICGSALNPIGPDVRRELDVPLIDMAHAVSYKLENYRFQKIALLGVRTEREREMWRERFVDFALLEPTATERDWFLEADQMSPGGDETVACKIEGQRIVSSMRRAGAQAVILADHNFGRWIKANETLLPLFDAEQIHAWIAALWALESNLTPAPPCALS